MADKKIYHLIANEDLSEPSLPIGTGANATVLTSNATTQIKTASGKVGQIIVWDAGTSWQIDVYDHASANNNQVWSWVSADGKGTFALQIPMLNGIRVVTSGTAAGKCTVVWL